MTDTAKTIGRRMVAKALADPAFDPSDGGHWLDLECSILDAREEARILDSNRECVKAYFSRRQE